MKPLELKDCKVSIDYEPEDDIPIKGNASVIDPETDAETERWITEQLESGNDYAWCTAIVVVRPKDPRLAVFEGRDSLGAVSVKGEQEFLDTVSDHAMVENALAELNAQIEKAEQAMVERALNEDQEYYGGGPKCAVCGSRVWQYRAFWSYDYVDATCAECERLESFEVTDKTPRNSTGVREAHRAAIASDSVVVNGEMNG